MFAECCSCPMENREVTTINYKMLSQSASNNPQDCPRSEATETDDEVSEKGSCHEFQMFSRRECYGDCFAVWLEKTEACGVLGWSTTASRVLPYGMRVKKVKAAGLISQWNRDHPDMRVSTGDIITEVNGVSGSVDRMCDIIASDQTLALTMLKYVGNRTFPWRRDLRQI